MTRQLRKAMVHIMDQARSLSGQGTAHSQADTCSVVTFPRSNRPLVVEESTGPCGASGPRQLGELRESGLAASEGALSLADTLAFEQVLQSLPASLMLLSPAGKVVYANQEATALLQRADALLEDSAGVLRCRDRQAEKHLRSAVDQLLPARKPSAVPDQAVFAIPQEGNLPLVAIARLGPANDQGEREERRIILVIRDPLRGPKVDSDDLRSVFGLSGAEAEVVSQLVTGARLRQIAADRGVQLVTVRNQLKSAHAKLGVARQSELVSVVMRATHI